VKIKNWEKHQHFKDRRPPWIKLYKDILDQRDIAMLSDCTFRILIGLWLLASEDELMEGNLPNIDEVSFRLRTDKAKVIKALGDLDAFILRDDDMMISSCYQSDVLETETETEKRQRREETDTLFGFDDFWNAYDKKVERPAAIRAWKKAKVQNQETLDQIITAAIMYVEATPDKTYRKNPSTWINNQCWNDEVVKRGTAMTQHQLNQEGVARSLGLVRTEKQIEGNTYDAITTKRLG